MSYSTGIDYGRYSAGYYQKNRVNYTPSARAEENKVDENALKDAQGNECTDGNDDGKINFWSKIGNAIEGIGKSIVNGVKGMFTDENGKFSIWKTLKTVAMTAVCFIPGIGPAIGCAMAAVGIYKGVGGVISAAQAANNATTDAEAKAAWENIGGGAFTTAMSVVGLKASAGALSGQITGKIATHTRTAIINKSGIGKAVLKDMGNNAIAAGKGVLETGRRIGKLGGKTVEFVRHPSKLWEAGVNKATTTWQSIRNTPQRISSAIKRYESGFIGDDLATTGFADDFAANISDDIGKIKIDVDETALASQGIKKVDGGGYTRTSGSKQYNYDADGNLTSWKNTNTGKTYNVSGDKVKSIDIDIDGMPTRRYNANYKEGKLESCTVDIDGVPRTYKATYNKDGLLEGYTVDIDGVTYTYGTNGRLKTSVQESRYGKYTKEYGMFGRRKSSTRDLDGGGVMTEEYGILNPNKVKTSTTRNGQTTVTRSNGAQYTTRTDANWFTRRFGKKSGTYTMHDVDGNGVTFSWEKPSTFGRTTYRINGTEATTWAQRGVARIGRGYGWLGNQKPGMFVGPTFGRLSCIKPGSYLANADVQQMILAGELILD